MTGTALLYFKLGDVCVYCLIVEQLMTLLAVGTEISKMAVHAFTSCK